MQRIAREMHLSETTFILPPENGGDVRDRIFTPVYEVPFAGHPTLGTAIVPGESTPGNLIRMETAMGTIPFLLSRSGRQVTSARMDQPIPTGPYDRTDELLTALDLTSPTLPAGIYRNGPRHVYIGFKNVDELSGQAARPRS